MALLDNTDITAEQIAKEGLDNLPSTYQKSVGFFAWEYMLATAKLLKNIWDKIVYICSCLTDLSTMNESDLENYISERTGIERQQETYASGLLTVLNGSGTITEGDTFTTSGGTVYVATDTVEVSQNDTFNVRCETAGAVGNCDANTITQMPTTIQGIVSVTNESAFTNGYDKETIDELLERYYEYIRTPIVSGNKYHYKYWAKQYSGVGGAIVKPTWDGPNTVKVVIFDKNTGVASQELVNNVQNYIDPKGNNNETWGCGLGQAPIGAFCTVVSATAKNLTVNAELTLKSGYELTDVTANIEAKINTYLKDIIEQLESEESVYVSYSHISACISTAEGVKDHTDLTVNGGTSNISLTNTDSTTEVAILYQTNFTTGG